MPKRILSLILLLLVVNSPHSFADPLTDAALDEGRRFLATTPDAIKWAGPATYAKAWEQAMGLTNLLSLRYDGALPLPWINQINKRLVGLRTIAAPADLPPEAEQLRAMVDMYAEYAFLYMAGQLKYGDYMPARHYLPSGQWLAEKVRGKPYQVDKCTWENLDTCKSPPPVWAQK